MRCFAPSKTTARGIRAVNEPTYSRLELDHRRRVVVDTFRTRARAPFSRRPTPSPCLPFPFALGMTSSFHVSPTERQSLNLRRDALLPLSKYSALVTAWLANWEVSAKFKAERYASVIGLYAGYYVKCRPVILELTKTYLSHWYITGSHSTGTSGRRSCSLYTD